MNVAPIWQSEQADAAKNGGRELSIWRTEAKAGFYSIGSIISRSKTQIGAGILLKVSRDVKDAVRDPMYYTAINTGKGGFWRAHCPINYVPLGLHMTASKDQYPAQGEFYCVHQRYCRHVPGAHKHIFTFDQEQR